MAHPVFYDPKQARWRRLRRIFDFTALALTAVLFFFIYTALRSEPLPDLLLPMEKHPYHALKEKETERAREKRRLAAIRRGHRQSKSAPSQVKLNAEEGIRAAFLCSLGRRQLFLPCASMRRQIDLLYPEWLHVLTPDGRLQGEDHRDG